MKRLLVGVGIFLALVIVLGIGKPFSRAMHGAKASQDIDMDKALAYVANRMNSHLPMMIDKETRLDSTSGGSGPNFYYLMTLPSFNSSEIDPQEIHALAPQTKAAICSLAEMRPVFEMGVTVHNVYRGNDGKEITRVSISPADCGISP